MIKKSTPKDDFLLQNQLIQKAIASKVVVEICRLLLVAIKGKGSISEKLSQLHNVSCSQRAA